MYSEKEKAIIWLSLFDFLNAKKIEEILYLYNSPEFIFNGLKDEIKEIVGEENFTKMKDSLNINLLNSYIDSLNKDKVLCITYFSDEYPKKLYDLFQPPYILFCKGDVKLLKSRCFAVVGTRVPSSYGKTITSSFTKGLSENGFTMVSGLAMGVDKIAHETTLENGGKTIAVLGGGFNHIYPAMNQNLAKNIENNGLIISEYRPSVRPTAYNFPIRNRIIAGLCDGILITEAGEKSGALHTKEYALECGRDVFAVPGNVTSQKSIGTNRLLKSLQSALVMSFKDILDYYSISPINNKKSVKQLSFDEQIVVNYLKQEAMSLNDLHLKSGIEIKTLNSCLTTLQINGLIKKLPGNEFMISEQ